MKKLFFISIILHCFAVVLAQQEYLVRVVHNAGLPTPAKNARGIKVLTFDDNELDSKFASLKLKKFERAFPSAKSSKLQNVYILALDHDDFASEVLRHTKLKTYYKDVHRIIDETMLTSTPNDYVHEFYSIWGSDTNKAQMLARMPEAWSITTGDSNIYIGISDTEFDLEHEDLDNKIVYKDGYDHEYYSTPHGTRVAAMAAAKTNNDLGTAGTGYNCRLAVTTKLGAYPEVFDKLLQMSQSGVRVINTSWRVCSFDSIYQDCIDEIRANGTLFVASAGNSDVNCGRNFTTYTDEYCYPASYDNVLSVTSVGDAYAPGSYYDSIHPYVQWKNYHELLPGIPSSSHVHNDKVDLSSPGGYGTASAVKRGSNCFGNLNRDYCHENGTSFSAPFVAGIAGLVFSVNPCLTADEVEDILKSTAFNIYDIPDHAKYAGKLGAGRVDAYAAVNKANLNLTIQKGEDLFIQNQNISGSKKYVSTKDLYVGKDVDGLQPSGDVVVSSASDVVFRAGKSITFAPGSKVDSGVVMVASIFTPCSSYGEPFSLVGARIDENIQETVMEYKEEYIYPNPTSDIFFINEPSDVEIYTVSGFLVDRFTQVSQVDISHIESGVYIVKLNTTNSKRLVVVK